MGILSRCLSFKIYYVYIYIRIYIQDIMGVIIIDIHYVCDPEINLSFVGIIYDIQILLICPHLTQSSAWDHHRENLWVKFVVQ